ncbi:MAG: mannose-1-phosphate guanylyltransferase/mannose-6-phosphate isomerase [Nitrospinae bacterium]|nr:mannose-1-phosphate guanylyltransferase/mannose-6-phosphate isomerase [Nitrospinota bacterium]
MNFAPVILSGGDGVRLWPLSRALYPKQFLSLTAEKTLLQETVCRLDGMSLEGIGVDPPLIVCGGESRFLVKEQMEEMERRGYSIILEPAGRNTAPALTLAALEIVARHGDAVMGVFPADHVIRHPERLHESIRRAMPLAMRGMIAAFGIEPARPESAYGYIKRGTALIDGEGAHEIELFIEKPGMEKTREWFGAGGYYWNSGIFICKASVWLETIRRLRPDIHGCVANAHDGGKRDTPFFHAGDAFAGCPGESIDRCVMEKLGGPAADRIGAVLPLDAGWADVGSWSALWELLEKDGNRNAAWGDVFAHDTRGSLLLSETRLLAALGLEDVLIVETADAVLVAKKSHAEQVRNVVEWLKEKKRREHISHQRVFRPWGYYQVIDAGERYQVKRIMVTPGQSLSLQKHLRRAEHWVVVKGTAKVTCGEKVFDLTENQSTYIPIGAMHRLENHGTEPLEMIEVQSGAYLGEDDIIRFDDKYKRP